MLAFGNGTIWKSLARLTLWLLIGFVPCLAIRLFSKQGLVVGGTALYFVIWLAYCWHVLNSPLSIDDEDEPMTTPCSKCGKLTTFDPIYGDLCYRCIRADNE